MLEKGIKPVLWVVFLPTFLAAGWLLLFLPAYAQNTPNSADDTEVVESVFAPPDRHALKKLTDAQRLVTEGRYREAARLLGDILQSSEDYFFQPDKKVAVYRSLKAEAENLIGRMPREGQESFELQYGAQARQMFNEALAEGNLSRLAEVSRRFFHTRAGYQATLLLGLDHFDHNRPLAGALVLQRLLSAPVAREELEPTLSLNLAACWLRAGMSEKAREVLLALRRRDENLRVTVGGREVSLFGENEDPVAWLSALMEKPTNGLLSAVDDWLLFRGDACRNATATGSAPLLNFRWRVPIVDEPIASSTLNQYRRLFSENGIAGLPALHPLAVDDVLLIRTLANLQAVDIATGKRLWEAPLEEVDAEVGESPAAGEQNRAAMLATLWGHRLWNDLTYGTLSSDGRSVFSVEDPDLVQETSPAAVRRGVMVVGGGPMVIIRRVGEQTAAFNRLAARDIHNGKLIWELGGPPGPRELPLAGRFFLGPPLPLMGHLYVLAEAKNEIQLLALEASTGNLLWSQSLAVIDQNGSEFSQHWAGLSPSYAEGVLVCPTSAGAVVGVDLATRSLLWGVCYEQDRSSVRRRGRVQLPNETTSGWSDTIVTISGDRALLTPSESSWLYCLNLFNGELLWKCPRQNGIYLACVADGKAVLVGSNSIRAVRLEDGQPAWDGREQPLPENTQPSGRGFRIGENRYFLPLSNATVAVVDLETGEITATIRSRKGVVPGNLICHRGKVFSQGLEGVDAYLQLDAAKAEAERRLKADAADADALSLQGELLLESNRPTEAVAALRRAYELKPSPRTRDLLRDALLDGLQHDFAVYRQWSDELKRLLEEDGEQATFFRLMALGLRQEGRWGEAFQYLEQLADLATKELPLEKIGAEHYVRRDRWLQGQLTDLLAAADKESTQVIEQAISERQKTVLASSSLESLQRFVACFGNLPIIEPAKAELIRRLKAAGRVLDAEILSGKPETERPPAKQSAADWPQGKVEKASTPTKNPGALPYNRQVLELRGDREPWFHDLQFRVDQNRRNLIALNGLGQEQWQVSFVEKDRPENVIFNPSWINLYAKGRVLFFSLGWKMLAIEAPLPGGEPRVLWQKSFSGDSLSSLDFNQPNVMAVPFGVQQITLVNNQANPLGPVNRAGVFCLQYNDVVALDPGTGETLWVRSDLSNVCDLFGDEEHLFVLRSDQEEAVLLRAVDGQLLGTRKIPRQKYHQGMPDGKVREVYSRLENNCLTTVGRKLLLFTAEGANQVLKLLDPLDGREVWSYKKPAPSARAALVKNDDAVAVMEPGGRLAILNLADGTIRFEQQLEPEPNLMGLTVFRSGEQYFVVTSNNADPRKNINLAPLPGQQSRSLLPIYEGRLYALDKTGKLFWPAPCKVENQYLLAEQSDSLPVVIFAVQMYQQKLLGQGQWRVRLLCVDKRNGRKVYEEEFSNLTGVFAVSGDLEKKTIDLTMQHTTVKLTFSDKPLPPLSEAKSSPAGSTSGSENLRALWNAVLRALGETGKDNQNKK